MKKTLALLAAFAALTALPAAAQFQKPEDAIKYRQSAFTLMGNHFTRIGMMVQGRTPYDAKVAAENAALVAALAKLPGAAFGPGTDKGLPTRAKAEIWSDTPKFLAAYERMIGEVGKLDAAAKTGNLDALKGAFGNVAASCKNCHDNFRSN
jgi:cytochrome c556